MRSGPRLDVWIVGLMVSVCLLGAAFLVLKFNIGGIPSSPPENLAATSSPATAIPQFKARHKSRVPRLKSSKSEFRVPQEGGARGASSSGDLDSQSASPEEVTSTEAAASPDAELKTLKPLGYVQKSSGAVEAIVGDEDGVQVVHVGDAYQGKYTVAQIAPEGVKVAGSAVAAPHADDHQIMVAESDLTPAKSLGYAERRDGTRIDIVAENGLVSLTQVGKTQAASSAPQESASPVATSRNSNPPASEPKQVASNRNQVTTIVDKSNRRLEPARNIKDDISNQELPNHSALATTESDPSPSGRAAGQSFIPSGAIGFVEKADGKVQAFVDAGDGIRLNDVPKDQVAIMVARMELLDTSREAGSGLSLPEEAQAERLANLGAHSAPPPGLSMRVSRAPVNDLGNPANIMQPRAGSTPGEPQSSGRSDKPAPKPEEAIADDRVIPEKPPPDAATITASFGEGTEVGESAKREDAVLESLGLANLQNGRASPENRPFEPAAPATGPPETESAPSSFGYQDWSYGRASPIAADLRPKVGAAESTARQATVLKSIGYILWQDGRIFAVIDDGNGGVRLVAAGETLDGRYRVVRVGPDGVEIEDLGAKPISWVAPVAPIGSESKLSSDFVKTHPQGSGPNTKFVARAHEFFTRSHDIAGNPLSLIDGDGQKLPPFCAMLGGVSKGPGLKPPNTIPSPQALVPSP
ncbi:MAG TPA: hypothetical protein VKV95_06480 [Terriglobia bacterium]|nr:hypothetical protein [Terriglobia bacterium]